MRLSLADTRINSTIKRYNEQMRALVKEGLSMEASDLYAEWVDAGLDIAITEKGLVRIKQTQYNRNLFKQHKSVSKTWGRTLTQVKKKLGVETTAEARMLDKAKETLETTKDDVISKLYPKVQESFANFRRGGTYLNDEEEEQVRDYEILKNEYGKFSNEEIMQVLAKYGHNSDEASVSEASRIIKKYINRV